MKALVICDDINHPGSVIQEGLSFLEPKWKFDFMMDMTKSDLSSASLQVYDVIILCKDNQISHENKDGWLDDFIAQRFMDYTENGGGFLVIHAGTVACKWSDQLRLLVGCEFVRHPDQCYVEYIPLPGVNDSIINGVSSFTEIDELYTIQISADDAEVFLDGKSEYGEVTAGYSRLEGNGRVVVLTPGHHLSVWQNEEYRKILTNSLYWCAGRD